MDSRRPSAPSSTQPSLPSDSSPSNTPIKASISAGLVSNHSVPGPLFNFCPRSSRVACIALSSVAAFWQA